MKVVLSTTISNVLKPITRTISIDPLKEYPLLGIRLDGRGVFLRERKLGSEIAASTLYQVKSGDFIYSRLFAWRGAFGIISDDFDDCYVSSEFPTFIPIQGKIESRFLQYWFRLPSTLSEVAAHCTGSTPLTRNRFKENFFLALEIPLPSLEEQQRIVARIEELAARIEEARGLRREAVEQTEVVFTSTINKVWSDQSNWNIRYVKDLVTIVSGQINPTIEPYASLPHINGEAIESGTCRLLTYQIARDDGVTSGKYHFRPNSILFSKIRPYLRKAVQVPVEGICSADIYAFESINPALNPRFFMYSLIVPNFTSYANTLSGRTRMPKLNQNQLLSFQIAYPPLSEQRGIVNYLDSLESKLNLLKRLQSETSAELDALLPSILDKAFKGEL